MGVPGVVQRSRDVLVAGLSTDSLSRPADLLLVAVQFKDLTRPDVRAQNWAVRSGLCDCRSGVCEAATVPVNAPVPARREYPQKYHQPSSGAAGNAPDRPRLAQRCESWGEGRGGAA